MSRAHDQLANSLIANINWLLKPDAVAFRVEVARVPCWQCKAMPRGERGDPGLLDLLVVARGRAALLDGKRGKDELRPSQLEVQRLVRLAGGVAEEFRDVDAGMAIVREMMGG